MPRKLSAALALLQGDAGGGLILVAAAALAFAIQRQQEQLERGRHAAAMSARTPRAKAISVAEGMAQPLSATASPTLTIA